MALRRFYVRAGGRAGNTVKLEGSEARHLSVVIRGRVGQRVVLFNEKGEEFLATIVEIGRGGVSLRLGERVEGREAPPCALDIAAGLVKGRAMERVLSGSAELGARGIMIVRCARSVPRVRLSDVAGRLSRWERIVLSAAKQCGRPVPPAVEYLPGWADLLARVPRYDRVFIGRHGSTGGRVLVEPSDSVLVIVGPEGGLTDGESAAAVESGAVPLALGPYTLRSETAALAALSLMVHALRTARDPSAGGQRERA